MSFRIGGLASGMDIDQMVSELIKAESYKVDKIKQNKQITEWQRDAFREINNSLRALRDNVFQLRLQRSFMVYNSNSSKEDVLTISASSTATPGTYSVKVDQLAQGVLKGSQESLSKLTNEDGTVKTLAQQFELSGTVRFTLEGKMENGTALSKEFVINSENANIHNLVQEINEAKLGITANYDTNTNRFFLTTTGTGEDYGIKVSGDDSGLFSDANGDGSGKLKLMLATDTRAAGQNAVYSFGDMNNLTSTSNTVTVAGITMNLKQGDGATSTVTVTRDNNAVFDTIKSFVEKYNSTIDLINQKLNEKPDRNYQPLTDSQRESLSEKQQEQWEERAKIGLLRSEPVLMSAVNNMRRIMGGVVSGVSQSMVNGKSVTFNSLASIGIVTGSYQEQGKLHLKNDGEDLRKAIEADPEAVMRLFASTDPDNPGIAQNLSNQLGSSINTIVGKAGAESGTSLYDNSALGTKLRNFDKDITGWMSRLQTMEARYYKQFTAMERALSQMNSQSAWLAQQFGNNS